MLFVALFALLFTVLHYAALTYCATLCCTMPHCATRVTHRSKLTALLLCWQLHACAPPLPGEPVFELPAAFHFATSVLCSPGCGATNTMCYIVFCSFACSSMQPELKMDPHLLPSPHAKTGFMSDLPPAFVISSFQPLLQPLLRTLAIDASR